MPSDQPAGDDNPLNQFSGCHEGIIDHFKRLQHLLILTRESPNSPEICTIAKEMIEFFNDVVLNHHVEEEQELFTAVMAAAANEAEATEARTQIKRLVAEHRELEAIWQQIEPDIKRLAKAKSADLDQAAGELLAAKYLAHARFEEQTFLPLSARILSKNDLSALGLSLHMRHQQAATKFYI